MNKISKIGQKAPQLKLSEWAQGKSTNLEQLLGQVVLINVFQVNCPGCFLYSLPLAIDLHKRYFNKGLTVLGIATAFEDFDKNTIENLNYLLQQNKVIGETLRVLEQENRLIDGQLPYHIPFPVAMDHISKQKNEITEKNITSFIRQHVPNFTDQNEHDKKQIQQQVVDYLDAHLYTAETFTSYALRGTPSYIVIDKKGVLRASEFGSFSDLEWLLNILLQE